MNDRNFRTDGRYLVCGAGAGFGQPPDASDKERWRIAFVRGRKTAAMMRISEELAISDPAVVIPRLTRFPARRGTRGTIFIPHCHSDASPIYDWKRICARAGIDHVSPRRDSHWVIRAISSATRVITESMHGAIIADAFRVPWKPVSLVEKFNPFKWDDWGDGLNIKFDILTLPKPVVHKGTINTRIRSFSRKKFSKALKWSYFKQMHSFADVDFRETGKQMVSSLQEMKVGDFYLSDDRALADVQEKIFSRLLTLGSACG